ncbi:MAG: hypothetical protein ACI83D_000076 [Planctomycetota bacterium]|jgi:hypothetical protein
MENERADIKEIAKEHVKKAKALMPFSNLLQYFLKKKKDTTKYS